MMLFYNLYPYTKYRAHMLQNKYIAVKYNKEMATLMYMWLRGQLTAKVWA